MKQISIRSIKHSIVSARRVRWGLVSLSMLMAVLLPAQTFADTFDDQITQLQGQINQYQQQAADLHNQAVSLQGTIDGLVAQQNVLQGQINIGQVRLAQLKQEIADNEIKLRKQQNVLASTLASLYVNSTTTPVEMLASSNSIGDYVDQQQYRDNVREGIKRSIGEIKTIKQQLEDQQTNVERELADQQARNTALDASRRQQADLLAQTQGQEAAFQQIINQKNSEVASLRAQQAAINRTLGGRVVAGDPGHGSYPAYLNNAPQDSLVDPWGMYNRECVSYTAWKVYQYRGYMPYWGGHGNANQWPASAAAAGIPMGSTPRPHSVAIWNVGYYGHAMWVEAVNGDQVVVSQYNYDYQGHYSEMVLSASAVRLTYIYF